MTTPTDNLSAFAVSRRVARRAVNLGEHPAIWLAADFRRKTDA